MKYFEFGQEHSELMVMLHGGGVSYLGMLPTAQKLAERYHVVLVAYDGFNPGEPETEFVSPMDEARRLGDYVVEHYGGKIDILYGISYGCLCGDAGSHHRAKRAAAAAVFAKVRKSA